MPGLREQFYGFLRCLRFLLFKALFIWNRRKRRDYTMASASVGGVQTRGGHLHVILADAEFASLSSVVVSCFKLCWNRAESALRFHQPESLHGS